MDGADFFREVLIREEELGDEETGVTFYGGDADVARHSELWWLGLLVIRYGDILVLCCGDANVV